MEKLASCFSSTKRVMKLASSFSGTILQDILSRLDVTALTRFKLVSKAWFHLISDPRFQELHYFRSQRTLCLFFRSPISCDDRGLRFFYEFFTANFRENFVKRSRLIAQVDDAIKLVLPCCRGLFCFATETCIYVHNPATLQLLALPPFCATRFCGFGMAYIASTKCYRVVRLLYIQSTQRIQTSVLQLHRGARESELSWRTLPQTCPYLVQDFSLPASAQGKVYWKIDRSEKSRRDNDDILCFNFEEDKFSVIPYPPDWRAKASDHTQLVNLDGMLSMVHVSAPNIAVWVHRHHQWRRKAFIEYGNDYDQTCFGRIHHIQDHRIIFASYLQDFLIFLNTKNGTVKKMQFPFRVKDVGIYWESLFPLGDSH